MKHSAIACAALMLACGVVHAQTSVTVYGVVDIGIKYDNSTSPSGTWSESTGNRLGSRLGFRGTEQLGDGMRLAFTLESGFNPDDGTLNNGGRLWGRQAWVGLEGNFGAAYLGRQYSSTYLALKAIDPFKNQEAGNGQRVYGYGLGQIDPISRADNTVTYQTPAVAGWYVRGGYKFGESANGFRTNSSKFVGLVHDAGPWVMHVSWQDSDGVPLGAATTQLGGIVAPTGLGSSTVRAKNAYAGVVYNLGFMKLHAGYGDTKLTAVGDADIRNTLLGVTVPVPTGTVIASWDRSDVRDLAHGVSQQVGIGYSYRLGKRTDLYTSASWTRNDSQVALNAYAKGASEHEVRAGISHGF
jgi:predicted porin